MKNRVLPKQFRLEPIFHKQLQNTMKGLVIRARNFEKIIYTEESGRNVAFYFTFSSLMDVYLISLLLTSEYNLSNLLQNVFSNCLLIILCGKYAMKYHLMVIIFIVIRSIRYKTVINLLFISRHKAIV